MPKSLSTYSPPPARALVGALALSMLVGAGCGAAQSHDGAPDPYVARAGDVGVTASAFRAAYRTYLLTVGLEDGPALRRAFVEDLLAQRLLIARARAEGIEETPAVRFERERLRRKLVLDRYAQRVLFDTLRVRDADLHEAFRRMHSEATVRHLYARTRAQAEALRARLVAGEPFEALAAEVFADPALARNGGLLGTIRFDEADPAFEEAAFTLPIGVVSAPVRTAQGYSILRVEDRFTQPLLTETAFAEAKPRLEAFVRRRARQQARLAHVHALEEALAPAVHAAAFGDLLGQVTGAAAAPAGEALDAWLDRPLLTFGPPGARQTWTLRQFREYAQYADEAQRAQVQDRAGLEAFLAGLAVRETMLAEARARGFDRAPAFAEALRAAVDGVILDATRERLMAEVRIPEDSLRAVFEAAPEAEFVVPAAVRLREMVLETKAAADALKAQAAAGAFAALARLHSVRAETRAGGGDLGYVALDALGPLAEPVAAAAEGAVLGPFEVQGRYVLLEVGARRPARRMTFEEARPGLEEQARFAAARRHLKATYASLRARHPVEIDTDLLHSLTLTDEATD